MAAEEPKSKREMLSATQVMDAVAERYVKVALKLGQYDEHFIDAYYGPEEWKVEKAAKGAEVPKEDIMSEVAALTARLHDEVDLDSLDHSLSLRLRYLRSNIKAVGVRCRVVCGETVKFDDECRDLYDAECPHFPSQHYLDIRAKLEHLVPGEGELDKRCGEFRAKFQIPTDKVDAVFQAAVKESRARTAKYFPDLPDNERLTIEYVDGGVPWSGYNWYKGNNYSLVQVNTDLPIGIDRAVDLAAHEAYPGHHVQNVLAESEMVRNRGWVEYTVWPLYSPGSTLAEGAANFGIECAFPGEERRKFETEVLFPLAGLDVTPEETDRYYQVCEALDGLSFAGNEAAKMYLDGDASKEETVEWMLKHTVSSRNRLEKRLRFIDAHRAYVINYNLGLKITREYVISQGGTSENPERRWEVLKELLSHPRTASTMLAMTKEANDKSKKE